MLVHNTCEIDEYSKLVNTVKNNNNITGQAHHMNQNAAYSSVVPRGKGISINLDGNAFTGIGSPHYKAHSYMESFWDNYRRGGQYEGQNPSNLQYTKALLGSLQEAGLSRADAMKGVRSAVKQRVEYGLLGGGAVPNIPRKIYHKR